MIRKQWELSGQLFSLAEKLKSVPITLRPQAGSRRLTLATHCLSCLIYVNSLSESRETSYDRYNSMFQEITSHAEVSRSLCPVPRLQDHVEVPLGLSLDLGLTQPLYFTAVKCREPRTRRRAVALLASAGRDGPFDAGRQMLVARRVLELEESAANPGASSTHALVTAQTPEDARLHSAGVDGTQTLQLKRGGISAAFSSCNDIQAMMRGPSPDTHKDTRWCCTWTRHFKSFGSLAGPWTR